jgi:stage II sporulation protein M
MKKISEKKGSLYGQFLESWKSVAENRRYIYFSIILFLLFVFIAIFLPIPVELEAQLQLMIQKLVLATDGLNWLELISYIFVNNFGVAIIAILFGGLFCFVPFIIVMSNGYVLGYVIKLTLEKLGMSDGLISLWRILPHGIFEIPAIMIGLGIGFKLGISFFQSLNQNSFKIFLKEFWRALKVILFVILPLLVIAAIIEGILIKAFS